MYTYITSCSALGRFSLIARKKSHEILPAPRHAHLVAICTHQTYWIHFKTLYDSNGSNHGMTSHYRTILKSTLNNFNFYSSKSKFLDLGYIDVRDYKGLITGAWSSILKSPLNPKTENLIMSLRSNDIVSFWFWGYRGDLRIELQAPVA